MAHSRYAAEMITAVEAIRASQRIADRIPGLIAADGKSGTARRRNPNVPSFSMMLASTTEPVVGASTCASRSHVWNGNIGTFTANARKKAPNSHFAAVAE